MGTSRSGNVGSSTKWGVTRDDVEALTEAIVGDLARSIPQLSLPESKKKGSSGSREGEGGGKLPEKGRSSGRTIGPAASIPQGPVPRTIRALGKRLVAAGTADKRFKPELGHCAVKVTLDILIGLFTAATLKHRTSRDTDKLLAEYGLNDTRNLPSTLAKAIGQRYGIELIRNCKTSSDAGDRARRALQFTLIEILSPDGTASEFGKLNGSAIHAALRRTSSMKIVERFYSQYMQIYLEQIMSSLHADISQAKEKTVLKALRITYSDYVAKEIVKRAREKGLSASQIPDKVDEWIDLLTEEEVHA